MDTNYKQDLGVKIENKNKKVLLLKVTLSSQLL